MSRSLMVRVTAPVMASSALLLLVGFLTAWYVHRLQQRVSDMVSINVASLRAAEEIEIALLEVRSQLDLFLITGNMQHLDKIPRLQKNVETWLLAAERVATTEREQELMAEVRSGYEHFLAEFNRLPRGDASRDVSQQVRELIDTVLSSEILPPAHAYLEFNEEEIAHASEENQKLGNQLIIGLLFLGVCGCGAGLLAGLAVARGVSRSIIQLNLPIRDAAGQLSQVVGPVTFQTAREFQDLEGTLRKMAGHIDAVVGRLRQREREVLRAEQLAKVGQMAAGIAHELRNPLMSMKLIVQATGAQGTKLDGRDLAILEEEIVRLERSTQTFLDFARPPQPEKRHFDPRALVEQTQALIGRRAALQRVRIESEIPGALLRVEADPEQVRQVLLNLLLNALDALPQGGTVWVTWRRETHWLMLRVADDGPGLPPELEHQVFEPFLSTKTTGMGLGLSICKRIAEAHGGYICAENRSGGGAVFTFRLPCTELANDRSQVSEGSYPCLPCS